MDIESSHRGNKDNLASFSTLRELILCSGKSTNSFFKFWWRELILENRGNFGKQKYGSLKVYWETFFKYFLTYVPHLIPI